nr:unnamed protein product [Callosobruchus analis]
MHSRSQFFADDTQRKYDIHADNLQDTEKSFNEDLENISKYCSSHNISKRSSTFGSIPPYSGKHGDGGGGKEETQRD